MIAFSLVIPRMLKTGRLLSLSNLQQGVMNLETRDIDGKKVETYFQNTAQNWHTMYVRKDLWGDIHQQRLATFMSWVDRLGVPAGTRVLDAGCGAGMATVALAKRGYLVESTDVASSMVQLTRKNAQAAGIADRVHAETGDIYDISYPREDFDLTLSIGVIPWLQFPDQAVAELARVTKRGGHLLFTADNRWRLAPLLDPSTSPVLAKPKQLLKKLLPSLNVSPSAQEGIPSYQHSLREVDRFLSNAGLERVQCSTLGFGPFTLFYRPIPQGIGLVIHHLLQRLVDWRIPIIRSLGAQFLILARKR